MDKNRITKMEEYLDLTKNTINDINKAIKQFKKNKKKIYE